MSWGRESRLLNPGLSRDLFRNYEEDDDTDMDTAGSDFHNGFETHSDIVDPECTESEPVFASPEVRNRHRHYTDGNLEDGPSSPFKIDHQDIICSSPTRLRDRVNELHLLTSPTTPMIIRRKGVRLSRTPRAIVNTVIKSCGSLRRGIKRNLTPREVNVNPFSPFPNPRDSIKKHKPSPLNGSFLREGSFVKDGSSESCPVMITDGEDESEEMDRVFEKSSSEPDPIGASAASGEHLPTTSRMSRGDGEHDIGFIPYLTRYVADFREEECLGAGESGSVFKCYHRLEGLVYAVKKSSKPTTKKELQAHAVVGNHRRIVRYYGSWKEDNIYYIQSEFCAGGSLSDLLEDMREKDKSLSEYQLKRIMLHVAQGLRFMHHINMAHMDIKPDNIFLTRKLDFETDRSGDFDDGFEDEADETETSELCYKIGDMGLASIAGDQTTVEEGDARYMAPELLNEDCGKNLTKSDIFSLALTIIELITKEELPGNGTKWSQYRSGDIPLFPEVSHDLNQLLRRMLSPTPEGRRPPPKSYRILFLCLLQTSPKLS